MRGIQPYNKDGDAVDPRNRMDAFLSAYERIKQYTMFGRAIDIGCGNGRISRVLAKDFGFVLAVDPVTQIPPENPPGNVIFSRYTIDAIDGDFDLALYWGSFYLIQEIYQDAKIVVIADEIVRNLDYEKGHKDGDNYSLAKLAVGFDMIDQFVINDYLRVYVLKNDLR